MYSCQYCPKRQLYCHVDCDSYNEERKLNEERREKKRQQKLRDADLNKSEVERHTKPFRNHYRRVGK